MFIDWTGVTPAKPALVLVDNHDSRFDATMRAEAEANGVILLLLPANTTFALQPLDVVCFGVFKKLAHQAVDESHLSGVPVNYNNRWSVISKAWVAAISPDNIISAFAQTGIWPLNNRPASVMKQLPPDLLPLLKAAPGNSNNSKESSSSTEESKTPLPFNARPIPNALVPVGGKEKHMFDDILIVPPADSETKAKDGGFSRVTTVPLLASEMEQKQAKAALNRAKKAPRKPRNTKATTAAKSAPKPSRKRRRAGSDSSSAEAGSQQETKQEEPELQPRPKRARVAKNCSIPTLDNAPWSLDQLKDYLQLEAGTVSRYVHPGLTNCCC